MPHPSSTMKIRAERAALADALGWVARALPKNPPVPILAGIRLSASEGVVRLSAFDYETQHTAALEATVTDGECVVPGLFLRDAVAGGRGTEVDLVLDGSQLEIASGRSTYRARCFTLNDAPALPDFPDVRGVVNAERLRDAVSRIAPAVLDDTPFTENQGVHIEGDADVLTLVATDRHRFHAMSVPWNGEAIDCTVPGRPLIEAVKGMSDDVEVGASENLLGLSDGRHQWTTRQFAVPYLAWRTALERFDAKCTQSLAVERDDLLAAVRQIGGLVQQNRPVIVTLADGELTVRTPEQDAGDGCEAVAAQGDAAVSIAANPRFLADALGVTEGPVAIRYGGSYEKGSAFIIADRSAPDLTLIVMSKSMPGGTQ